MSWRILFAMLLVTLGVSAWGGIQFGDWLVAHAPASTRTDFQSDAFQGPILDANGRPYMAQPPQPRLDGTLGVPERPPNTNWTVATVSLFDTVKDASVQISRNEMTLQQATQLAATAQQGGGLSGEPHDVSTLDLAGQVGQDIKGGQGPQVGSPQMGSPQTAPNAPPFSPSSPVVQPINIASAESTPPASVSPVTQEGWQEKLKHELEQCAQASFFQRPTCAWRARQKYCEPNHAWGQVAECPKQP